MAEPRIQTYAELLSSLPVARHRVELDELRAAVEKNGRKIVVLDDDPTGCQTTHEVPVWTAWDVSALTEALRDRFRLFFIIVNTRSLPEAEAVALNRTVVANLGEAAKLTGTDLVIVSRSDSTLRGHYPAETDVLQEELEKHLGWRIDGTLLIPFFLEGGRLTAHDIHWVRQGDQVIPAGQTEYAQDPAFPYHHSHLRAWVAEKTGGRIRPEEVLSISLEDIRLGGPQRVAARLAELRDGRVGFVNAVTYEDMDVFVLGLLHAEARGQRFLYRTAASFIRSRAAVGGRGLVTGEELLSGIEGPRPGLVLVGSFVPRSTEQLSRLLELPYTQAIELRVADVLQESLREAEIRRAVAEVEKALQQGRVPTVYTTRSLVAAEKEASLRVGQKVSAALVELVRRISTAPGWIIAKGGVTAYNIATHALGVRQAFAPGQVSPGVPVWVLGAGSRFPGLPYVVFPGNVGRAETVAEVVQGFWNIGCSGKSDQEQL